VADLFATVSAQLGEPLMVVHAEERARGHQSIIYAWMRGDEVLYIGASWRGVERPLGVSHEKLRECAPGDRIVIWACPASDLVHVEDGLIRRYRPRYNKPNGGTPCPDCGGRWKLLDHPAGCCELCQRRRANGAKPLRLEST
jgi:tRNA(Ile2) C34 agmatinyltransferase TiaS